jgi:hypothetical protein
LDKPVLAACFYGLPAQAAAWWQRLAQDEFGAHQVPHLFFCRVVPICLLPLHRCRLLQACLSESQVAGYGRAIVGKAVERQWKSSLMRQIDSIPVIDLLDHDG